MVRKLHLAADKRLAELQRQISFTLVNPENSDAVKKRFFRKPYNPEFYYAAPPDTDRIRERLASIKCGRTKPGRLLAREKKELFLKTHMVESIGTASFPRAVSRVYGKPRRSVLRVAEELVQLPRAKPDKKILYAQTQNILEETFHLLGFQYAVRKEQLVSSAYLSPSKQTLFLKSKERFGRHYAYRIAVHEIATHALRAENGRSQGLGIFSRGTPGYLATEEGLAAYNEERAGLMTTDYLKNYAGRVIAVHTAAQESFVDTYNVLREWFSKEEAFKLSLRAKRGLGDASMPGACTKDHVYLDGYLAIKDYAASGGDLTPLFTAKISLEDLSTWKQKLGTPVYRPEPVIEWVRQTFIQHPEYAR